MPIPTVNQQDQKAYIQESSQKHPQEQLEIEFVRITKVSLSAFRNYTYEQLTFQEPFVLLSGCNGAGKTNILEALSYLAPGKGLRRASLSHIIQAGKEGPQQPWAVTTSVLYSHKGKETDRILSSGLDPHLFLKGKEKRVGRIDGEDIKNLNDFEQHLSLFWLTPDIDRLFKESPGVRRKFLDKLIMRWEPAAQQYWQTYENALRQRMFLLKTRKDDDVWLYQLEKLMVESGMAILHERMQYVSLLSQTSQEQFEIFPKIEFHLKGMLEDMLVSQSYIQVEAIFYEKLKETREKDAIQGMTTVGPHTTNFQALYTPKGIYAEQCSTGEVKMLLLALVLTAARLESWRQGRTPLMLLDEGMSHLDKTRRQALGEELLSLGVQTFMTSTDEEVFSPIFSHAARFCVKENRVKRI